MEIQELYQHFLLHPKVSTDSRNMPAGGIFFGIHGPNFNGNNFAHEALESGASLVVADDPLLYGIKNIVVVEDSLKTLQDLATFHRNMLNIPVIGITGSNGKTTTKELVKTVLETTFNTLYTKGNLNNHIGVPLTMLEITRDTEIAVIEMGANHLGEIAELCAIAQPTLGILTNIGKAHLGGFGGLEGIIETKKALYQAVSQKKGLVFVNSDNELLMELSTGMNRWTFGTSNTVNTLCTEHDANPMLLLKYLYKDLEHTIQTNLLGDYNYENVLAALSVGQYLNIATEVINHALSIYTPSNNRSQLAETGTNVVFLDAYNANPSSMQAAISNFHKVKADKKFLILGDMLELGDESEAEHQRVIRLLLDLEFDKVILVGPCFQESNTTSHFLAFPDAQAASEFLRKHPLIGYTVLLKGSRGLTMEKIMEVL
ncbi:MAG: UDP-N-acetylmuramoyl-tripeptide--D-alanyl-D-alanine ligase [Bacteroidota bacterium]